MMGNEKLVVSRKDISVNEQVNGETAWDGVFTPTYTAWEATLSGRLSSGEGVMLSRTGKSFSEALVALEGAISDLGWEVL